MVSLGYGKNYDKKIGHAFRVPGTYVEVPCQVLVLGTGTGTGTAWFLKYPHSIVHRSRNCLRVGCTQLLDIFILHHTLSFYWKLIFTFFFRYRIEELVKYGFRQASYSLGMKTNSQ